MANYFKTKSGKRAKNFFRVGAAVVIIGAWAKILHIADPKITGIPFLFLYVNTEFLLTEAVIFFISGFISTRARLLWEKSISRFGYL